MLLDNRRWWLKASIAALAFLGLCADAAWRLPKRYPLVEEVLRHPDAWDGKRIWVEPSKVVETAADYVVLDCRGALLKVLTSERYGTGSWIYAVGIFHKDKTMTPERMRRPSNWPLQRGAVYVISAIVLIFFARHFLRTFSISRRGFAPRPSATVI